MNLKPYILEGYTIESFRKNLDEILGIYSEYGVVIFPGLLNSDPNYIHYVGQLNSMMSDLIQRKIGRTVDDLEIGDKLTFLAANDPLLGKIIANLGTQHNKFFSFNKVKYSGYLEDFLRRIWGSEAIIATPQAGDTLHLFPPGEKFHRYNLPPHQDYQYLMQSPQQVTMYFGISKYNEGVGGLRIWEKSHSLGILRSHKNTNGAFEVNDWERVLGEFELFDFSWNPGDFGIFDSLLAHSSIPNVTSASSRIVQIFRYSNLNNPVSRSYDFGSTTYTRAGCDFVVEHSDLFVE